MKWHAEGKINGRTVCGLKSKGLQVIPDYGEFHWVNCEGCWGVRRANLVKQAQEIEVKTTSKTYYAAGQHQEEVFCIALFDQTDVKCVPLENMKYEKHRNRMVLRQTGKEMRE